ncbi:MAG: hypothetical protein H6753_03480 [Candidatus Omnitrophica bacterium]|nr:hypothetical protein [Candidatus Omnitrophota bacterium]
MRNIFLITVWLFLMVSIVPATPPNDLQLQYDPVEQNLAISMHHPTAELREHYIRTITVTVNNEKPEIHRLPFQRSASEVKISIFLDLKPGDAVHVKASCSLGGSAEADLVIPPQQESAEK